MTAGLKVLDAHPHIKLLFTDVGLPGGMNGRQLADEARRRRPHLRVLFTTAYARNAIVHDGRLDPGVELITKPYCASRAVNEIERHAGRKRRSEPRSARGRRTAHSNAGGGFPGGCRDSKSIRPAPPERR